MEEVSQRILRGTFAMIMLVDMSQSTMDFNAFSQKMTQTGQAMGCLLYTSRCV